MPVSVRLFLGSLTSLFSFGHILIPFAVESYATEIEPGLQKSVKMAYVFGVRIAYWATD